jgi:site-specific DNA recombinase
LIKGPGKPKTPDPERAAFVRMAFELYASRQYSIRGLLAELQHRGFRNKAGKPISKGCLENLLDNPFYCGRIVLRRSGRSYIGIHQPLVSEGLFKSVQAMKAGKQQKRETRHNHLFRQMITCELCGRSLIGERQKGRVYMRCQTKSCPTKTIREDVVEAHVKAHLMTLRLTDQQYRRLRSMALERLAKTTNAAAIKALDLRRARLRERQERLTDALIDHLIDKETYRARKQALDVEENELRAAIEEASSGDAQRESVLKFLELARNLYLHYEMADLSKRRWIVQNAFSNFIVRQKSLSLNARKWLRDPENTVGVLCGAPLPVRTRTEERISALSDALTPDQRDLPAHGGI